ncbi:MAG: fasciclin domain-containing protein [Myxococcota bacterium]|nr:fasciclin domain-containing protein [Myxococcota bacterium]
MRWYALSVFTLSLFAAGCSIGPSVADPEPEPEEESIPVSNLLTDKISREGDCDKFVAALEASGLGDVLRGNGPFTVFVPSDAALERIPALNLDALSDDSLLNFLKYHVIVGDLTGNGAENTPWASSLSSERIYFGYEHQSVVVNGLTQLTTADTEADNGRFHRIDLPLLPATDLGSLSIADVLTASPRLNKVATALSDGALMAELNDTDGATFFAMSDTVLRDAGIDLSSLAPSERDGFLTTHLIDTALDTDALSDSTQITSRAGAEHTIEHDIDYTLNGTTTILWEDIVTSNGVIHIIDGILTTDGAQ